MREGPAQLQPRQRAVDRPCDRLVDKDRNGLLLRLQEDNGAMFGEPDFNILDLDLVILGL